VHNGAVIRQHMGHWHSAVEHAEAISAFCGEYFDPHLNLQRPCGVPEMVIGAKCIDGKQRPGRYRSRATDAGSEATFIRWF
jgi:hypothetical protein